MPPAKRKPTKNDCKFHCCAITDERKAEIAESAREPNVPTYGPACHCGLRGAKEPCPRHADPGTTGG